MKMMLTSLQQLPILISLLTIGLLYVAYRVIPYILINKKYSRWARAFRAERDREAARFLKDYDNTVPKDIQELILNSSASELLQRLRDNKFTSEQAVITLALRSIKIAIPMHYAADIDFYGALDQARQKDFERRTAADPSKLPMLHGLPISVKDHTTCKNLKVTAGLAFSLEMEKPDFDCNYVAVLRKNGAIPFISSNVPQGLGAIETYNNIFGRASNTWNPTRTVGGSSGGEAGLVATRCSVLGIGSDAAGSIRVPSAFNGIYGFAPTAKRVSLKKTINLRTVDVHYFREIGCSYGPMGQNVEDLTLICKSTFGQFQDTDMDTAPIEWNEDKYASCSNKKLRIGYNFDDAFCEPCPAIRNAMMETVEKLRARGHTLIEIKHDFTAKFLKVGLGIMCPYGIGNSVKVLLKGEKPSGYYVSQVVMSYLPRFLQLTFASIMEYFGQHRLSSVLRAISSKNLAQYYDSVTLREWLKDDYVEMWESNQLDGLISPVLPFTALKHGHSEAVSGLIGGTLIYNLMGAPAGVVPVRRVRKDEQNYEPKLKDLPALVIKNNTKESEGLPVAIQVAGACFQDEKCLGIMKEIEDCFDYHERQQI